MPHNVKKPSLAILLLLNEVWETANNFGVPTVTSLFVAAQICIFLGYIEVPWEEPWDVCISVNTAYYRQDWWRMFMSAVEHADEWHLYFNMVSFVWNGRTLEHYMGSERYGILMVLFIFLASFCYLRLNLLCFKLTYDDWYLNSCTIGFSGVVYAMKVLSTQTSTHSYTQSIIDVLLDYSLWAELIITQIVAPNISFIGHLSGIIVGLLFVVMPFHKPFHFDKYLRRVR